MQSSVASYQRGSCTFGDGVTLRWGNKDIHPGYANDLWHTERRAAFYLLLMWASLPNPIAWVVLLFGRRIFRKGVWDVDGGVTYRRWYG
jgi:hypothetical protein